MKKIQMQTALFALVLLLAWWQAGMWYEDRLMAEEHFRVASGLQGSCGDTKISAIRPGGGN